MLRPGLNAVHLEAVFETVHEPLLVLDHALRVVAANTAFYRTFEVAEGDTLGRGLHSLGDGQWNIPRLRPLLEEVLPQNATVEGFEVEHVFERVGRRVIVLNARTLGEGTPGAASGGRTILLVLEDVTARRAAEAALVLRNQEMEELAYTVSHDLKSPLVTITGRLGMLRRHVEAGDAERVQHGLDRIEGAAERRSRLIDDLLALSRIGHVRSEGTEVDVERLVRGIWDGFAPRLGPSACTFEVEPGLPHVLADEGRLAEVFENLLANAAKYACGAGATRVRVGGAVVGGETRFCVADDGPGIAPAYHERAFGLFQRLDSDRDGTGVGLAVVAKVMRVHGGRAWVESAEGAGTTFWIAFPARARVPQARIPHARDGALVVEDNGIGFDEKYLDRIFTPFQRLHAREAYEGTGMGLAICRKIAERHGGTIRATSTPGEGSRFVVTLAADAA